MAPVPLPPPHAGIVLPPAPEDPPSIQDIFNANEFVTNAKLAYRALLVPDGFVSEAIKYEAKVISANLIQDDAGAVMPAWLQPALNQALNPLRDRLDDVEASITGLQERVDRMDVKLTSIERTCALSYNMSVDDGQYFQLERVPFQDGSDPVVQHGLPALNNRAAIENLSLNHLRSYYSGYVGPSGNRIRMTLIKGVCKAIGLSPPE